MFSRSFTHSLQIGVMLADLTQWANNVTSARLVRSDNVLRRLVQSRFLSREGFAVAMSADPVPIRRSVNLNDDAHAALESMVETLAPLTGGRPNRSRVLAALIASAHARDLPLQPDKGAGDAWRDIMRCANDPQAARERAAAELVQLRVADDLRRAKKAQAQRSWRARQGIKVKGIPTRRETYTDESGVLCYRWVPIK